MAKGWSISKTTIDDRVAVLVGLGTLFRVTHLLRKVYFRTGIFIICYLAMFIWENAGLDPASTLYVYQSPPGT